MLLVERISIPAILIFFGLCFCISTANASCVYLQPVDIKPMDIGNMISWITMEEVDNQYFEIQKSEDGIEFEKIGEVKGAGFSNNTHTYRFLDLSLGDSNIFYRLLHFGSDGSFTVTETFNFERTNPNNLMITSMSSAITDKTINLSIRSEIESEVFFEIKNYQNSIVEKGNKFIDKGLNVLSFNLMTLKKGKYLLTINADGEKEEIYVRKVATKDMPKVEYVVRKK